MSRTAGRAARFFTVKDVTLRREAIVIAMALLLLAAAIPFAIVDTIEKGRVYLFSWQFIEELPQRFTGPGRFRFILQPMISILWGFAEDWLMPKREFSLHIQSAFPCRTSKRIVAKRSSRDQHAACHGDHHGRRLSAGPLPDSSSRRSLAGWADFHLLPLRTLQSTDETLGMVIEGKVKNAGFIQATRSAGREKGRKHGPDILLFYLRAVLFLSLITLYGCQELVPHDTQSLLISGFKRSEIFGIVAGFGTTFAAVPDLIAMLRRRSSAGMHPRMAAIMGAFQILWVYYGLLIASRPVILWNVVAVLVNSLSVGAYLYFVRKEKGQAKE